MQSKGTLDLIGSLEHLFTEKRSTLMEKRNTNGEEDKEGVP